VSTDRKASSTSSTGCEVAVRLQFLQVSSSNRELRDNQGHLPWRQGSPRIRLVACLIQRMLDNSRTIAPGLSSPGLAAHLG
jgi:hypothetical protein